MPYLSLAGLMLSLAVAAPAAVPAMEVDHTTQVDHHSGPVTARYRGALVIDHRQVGTVAPGGRSSTLGCHWSAKMAIARQATAASGHRIDRSFVTGDMATGHRTGWCSTQRTAIARDVAAQTIDIDRHLQALALEDHEVLRAELDRLHGVVSAG